VRRAALILALLLLAARLEAQGTSAQLTGTLCPGNGCLTQVIAGDRGSVHVGGTWVGTLSFESSTSPCTVYAPLTVLPVNGPAVAVSSTTTNGAWFYAASGAQCLRVRFTEFTSGTAQVTLFVGSTAPSGPVTITGGTGGLTALELDARLPLPVDAQVTASIDTTGLATAAGQTEILTSLGSIDTKLPALAGGRVPVTCDNCAGGGGGSSGGLTDAELRASPLAVTGTFYQATQPISGTVAVSNFPATQPVSGTVTATGPLTDAQLRATAVPVSGTFWQTTQPVSLAALPALAAGSATIGAISNTSFNVGNFPATQPVSGTVTATGPLTDTQLRASAVPVSGPLTDTQLRASAVPVSGTFFQATQPVSLATLPALAAGANTIGAISNTAFGATPPTLTKGTQGATGFAVQALVDSGRTAVALSYTTAAPTTTDTVVTALIKASGGVAAAGAQSITAAASKTLRITAVNAQIRTTTAALPWAVVALRMSNTTTCTATSSVVAYLAQGGTAAAIGNVGQFSTQFPDGFELVAGGSFCISVSGNVTTNVLTFSAQGFEY